jgi:site-specific recombinase XerD
MGKYFNQMKQDLELRNYSDNTVTNYLDHMKRFVKFHMKDPSLIELEDITTYQVYLVYSKKVSFSTFNLAVCSIKYFYKHILDKGFSIDLIPYQKKTKTLPNVLSRQEVMRIINAAVNLKNKALIQTIYATGVRLSELVNLMVSDIDSKRMVVRIDEGKGKKDRYVMLSKTLLSTLREYWKDAQPKPETYLFPGDKKPNTHFSRRSVQRIVKETTLRAHIDKNVTPHTLRHCFATHLLEDGVNIRVIQKLLGHKSLRATELYTHVAENYINQTTSPLDLLSNENNKGS